MNIIFLLRYWPVFGGGETVTRILANKFAELGYGVSVLYLWEKTSADMPFIDSRIAQERMERVCPPDTLHSINKVDYKALQHYLYDYIKTKKINIIVNQWWPAKTVYKAKTNTGAKLICCHHTSIRNNPIIRTLKQKIFYSVFKKDNGLVRMFRIRQRLYHNFRYSDKWVMLCDAFAQDAKRLFKKGNDKICAIPNPLSFENYISPDDIVKKYKEILFVGRIDENKRLPYVIDAWKCIHDKNEFSDWRLTVVGDGVDLEKNKNYAHKLQCTRIYFEGFQNPLEYYKRASLLVMTSANEGFGMVLVEAQANGCVPVVMDSFPALHDIIQHDDNGVIVRNDDIPGFVSALEKLMLHDDYRIRLACRGLETCQRFSIDTIITQWEQLFRALAGNACGT